MFNVQRLTWEMFEVLKIRASVCFFQLGIIRMDFGRLGSPRTAPPHSLCVTGGAPSPPRSLLRLPPAGQLEVTSSPRHEKAVAHFNSGLQSVWRQFRWGKVKKVHEYHWFCSTARVGLTLTSSGLDGNDSCGGQRHVQKRSRKGRAGKGKSRRKNKSA